MVELDFGIKAKGNFWHLYSQTGRTKRGKFGQLGRCEAGLVHRGESANRNSFSSRILGLLNRWKL